MSCQVMHMFGSPLTPKRMRSNHSGVQLFFLCCLLASLQYSSAAGAAADDAAKADDDGSCDAETTTTTYLNLVAEPQFGTVNHCKDKDTSCHTWSQAGECISNPHFMLATCEASCRSCLSVTSRYGVQQAISSESTHLLEEYMLTQSMHEYMMETVFQQESFESVKETCKNHNKDCIHWAAKGECTSNPEFMSMQCAPACKTCHVVEFNARCPNATTTTSPSLWTKPGDLNGFFDTLLTDAKAFQPTVYSIPSEFLSTAANNRPWVTVAPSAGELSDGPWVITLENLFDATECKHLIEQGHVRGYERSTDVGSLKADGTFDKVQSQRRTSTNTWCSGDCFHDAVVQRMTKRLETLLHIPTNYTESWQLLRYEVGQEYKEHHDFVQQQVTRAEGPRILTVFFYLNTVTKGGGTQFPALNNLTIYPKQGRVLIWPSVLNDNADQPDARTNHRALPVEDGIKYGANAWIHQRDYKTPQSQFCI